MLFELDDTQTLGFVEINETVVLFGDSQVT
jgi:hypothetical protein